MASKKTKVRTNLPYIEASNAICVCFSSPKDEGKLPDSDMVQLEAEACSPFEEGTYACSWELLGQTAEEAHYLTVIASEERLEQAPWYPTLKARHQLGRCRIDVSVLAWVNVLLEKEPSLAEGGQFVCLKTQEETLFLILEDGILKSLHAMNASEEEKEDVTLLLCELNRTLAMMHVKGVKDVSTVTIFAPTPADALAQKALFKELGIFETVRDVLLPEEMATEWLKRGLSKRASSKARMNVTPPAWREAAKALNRKLMYIIGGFFLAIAWGLCAFYLYIAPKKAEAELEAVRAEHKSLEAAYQNYLQIRQQNEMLARFQISTSSILEVMLLVCEAKPAGVTFTSLDYQQSKSVKIVANAKETSELYDFEKALSECFSKESLGKRFDVDPETVGVGILPVATAKLGVVRNREGLQTATFEILFEVEEEEVE